MPCLVVGLGASAGGLDAFRSFFANTPPKSGMAFVLVQHLDPHHKSLLAELLSNHTHLSGGKRRALCRRVPGSRIRPPGEHPR
jgi:two-component system CheB/CheR fusion protein